MTDHFSKFSRGARRLAVLLLVTAMVLIGCKNDAGSCSEGCQQTYFECNRRAVLFDATPNGDRPDQGDGGIWLLWLGCESDRAVCVSNCNQAISAQ